MTVWDSRSGAKLVVLKEHTTSIICIRFSPDAKRIVSESKDGTVSILNALDWQRNYSETGVGGPAAPAEDVERGAGE